MMPRRSVNLQRVGFTLVEMLVVLAVLGILAALLMVSVQSARESARRAGCLNNLRQLGIALHSYHGFHSTFPPGAIEPRPVWRNGRQFAWSALLLPHLEHEMVAEAIDFGRPFDDPVNERAAATVIPIYLCPSTPRSSPLQQGRGGCDYGGIYGERIVSPNDPPKGTMLFDRALRIRDIRDSLGTTLMISEDSSFPDGQWINGRNVFDQAFGINQAPAFENDIRSRHPGGANGLFCDSSVRFLNEDMNLNVLAAICTRAGGEVVQDF